MPAKRQRCDFCDKPYWASRSDGLYCSQRCRDKTRSETAKFETPIIPKSGVEGVTYNRHRRMWVVAAKVDEGHRKFVGAFKDMNKAIKFLREVEGK